MTLPDLAAIERAAQIVYSVMPPTPQYRWPLLCERAGTEVWVKHENHAPLGAFKTRSGLVYFRRLKESGAANGKVVAATRGNFGQAVALGASRVGMEALVYVPHGNSPAKNRAMRALGATLVECGQDFEEARREAVRCAQAEGFHYVPSFHEWLVEGTATYSLELFRAVPEIDVAFVPIGMGSGICGMCAAREALGLKTEIVGVVSAHARAYAESFERREAVEAPVSTRIADGMACRAPDPRALAVMWRHVARVVTVTDDEVCSAIRAAYDDTHNLAEGGGAAAIAAMLQEKESLNGKRVAVIMSGGNVDRETYAEVLRG
ncbi:MAG TPA: threonine dehydratase [Verrucomicrobiae bacterium]|nr:threonine dehydratase [Verrucomicrobiae bacterium]